MSFSSDVKKELSHVDFHDMHDCAAEVAALLAFGGEVHVDKKGIPVLSFHAENPMIAARFFRLTQELGVSICGTELPYTYIVPEEEERRYLLKICGFIDTLGRLVDEEEVFENPLLQQNHCQRAFLRGAFLASGSITDPEKNYHFEITCNSETAAVMLRDRMEFFGLEGKIVLRKRHFIVYMKEGSMISEMLAIMGSTLSKMDFENIRILKDVRNVVNRRVNCETANINKTVSAARKQIEDIEYIIKCIGLEQIAEPLRQIACARLEEPEATLKELGEKLDPPVGKSGVNHRLRKLSQLAEELKNKEGVSR